MKGPPKGPLFFIFCYNNFSMSKITKYLNQLITGNVFDSQDILEAYSVDRSALKITPRLVAFPESTNDIRKIMKFFDQLALKNVRFPVAIRGSGLDETGADLSTGIVISTQKLNHLEEIDTRERLVRVQTGITLKELNTALSVSGLTLPIKANENETIGSLIANCPTDNYAAKYGGIMSFVERAEIVLTNGECIQTGRQNAHQIAKKASENTLEGKIYAKLAELAKNDPETINKLHNDTTSSYGYPTIAYAVKKDTIDLLPLIFSSQGSLGIVSEVILRAEVIPAKPVRMVATFSSLKSTMNFLMETSAMRPLELNIVDLRILKTAEEYGKNLSKITHKLQSGYAVFVSFNDKAVKTNKKLHDCIKNIPTTSSYIVENEDTAPILDEFEHAIDSYLHMPMNGERVPIVSDFYIPSKNFVAFIKDLNVLQQKLRLDLPIFGSFIASNYSIRPKFKIDDENYEQRFLTFLRAGDLIINRQGGSITGGSPEGRTKAIITNKAILPEEKKLYKEIKAAFDPNNILNPDIKLGADANFTLKHLRTTKSPKIML